MHKFRSYLARQKLFHGGKKIEAQTQAAPALCKSIYVVFKDIPVSPEHHGLQFPVAGVCDQSLAEIAGSNPARDMDVCPSCCVLSGRGLFDRPIPRPERTVVRLNECD
jgi:hypothetical protein